MMHLKEVSFKFGAANEEMRNSETMAPDNDKDDAAVAPSKSSTGSGNLSSQLKARGQRKTLTAASTASSPGSQAETGTLKTGGQRKTLPAGSTLSPGGIAETGTLKAGGQRKSLATATNYSPGSIAETARLRSQSMSSTKAHPSRKTSVAQKGVSDDRTRAEQLQIKLKGVRRILKEADTNGNGVVTWEELRSKAPGLPEDPEHMGIRIDPDQGVDVPLMVNILYPADAKVLIQQHEDEKNRIFVLPKDKKNEIVDLFRVITGGNRNSTMDSLKLYHGLREVLLFDYAEAAAAYWQLMVLHLPPPTARENCGGDNDQTVPLERFTDWYIDNVLTDKFKNENFEEIKNKGTKKKSY